MTKHNKKVRFYKGADLDTLTVSVPKTRVLEREDHLDHPLGYTAIKAECLQEIIGDLLEKIEENRLRALNAGHFDRELALKGLKLDIEYRFRILGGAE